MAGHSRSKNGVASLAYVPAIHVIGGKECKTWTPGTSPGMTDRYSLISPRLMLSPSFASTVLFARPCASISTV